MTGTLHATVRYTEPMVRRAVRVFVWRSVFRRAGLWALAAGLLATGALLDLCLGQLFATGLAVAMLLLAGAFVAVIWWAHFRNTVGRFRALNPPEAEVAAEVEGLSIRSSEGAATVPWRSFRAVWVLPDCWMLFLAPNRFMTLPTAALPPELLGALRAHLPAPT